MADVVSLCIVLLLIVGALVIGLRSLGRRPQTLTINEQERSHQDEREPEQDPYQRSFHEGAVAEANRGPRIPNERTPGEKTAAQVAEVNQRELSELLPRQFVVVDLETTGLSPAVNEIIEIGALKITLDMDRHTAFQAFVKPTKPVPSNITKMTGITQQMVDEQGMELQRALQQLMEFMGDLPLVTYNAEFDMGFLWAAARRCNVALPNRYSCALKRARRAFPDLPSHRLSYVAERLNLPSRDQHRAVGDCERAAHVFLLSTVALNQKVRWTSPAILN